MIGLLRSRRALKKSNPSFRRAAKARCAPTKPARKKLLTLPNEARLDFKKNKLQVQHQIHRMSDYVVITPVRNEGRHFSETIASMVAQTARPLMWVIVDDGSKDETGALAAGGARPHPR